jgi:hypothetical protein
MEWQEELVQDIRKAWDGEEAPAAAVERVLDEHWPSLTSKQKAQLAEDGWRHRAEWGIVLNLVEQGGPYYEPAKEAWPGEDNLSPNVLRMLARDGLGGLADLRGWYGNRRRFKQSHSTRIEEGTGLLGGSRYLAVCSCGWRAKRPWKTSFEAGSDLSWHEREMGWED